MTANIGMIISFETGKKIITEPKTIKAKAYNIRPAVTIFRF